MASQLSLHTQCPNLTTNNHNDNCYTEAVEKIIEYKIENLNKKAVKNL